MDATALQRTANRLRRRDLKMLFRSGLGHPGGDMSVLDILTTLYFGVLNIDPNYPDWPDRDRLILSKGHCAGALYTTLSERGYFPESQLDTFAKPLSCLSGHPDRRQVPGVETNTGALGHGLPFAVGTALAAKLTGASWRTFVITGDGELQEGSNWEAAMAAAQYGLDNLTLVIDRNGLQQGSATEETMGLEPLAAKWKAFGWGTAEVDGHDCGLLLETFSRLPLEVMKPSCIIAQTHKGQGVSYMCDQAGWHHRIPTQDELVQALLELGGSHDT